MFSACGCLLHVILLLIIFILAANVSAGDTASLIYLWNPWTIITCVGSCTSPIENLMVVLMIYGACSRKWDLLCSRSQFTKFISIVLLKVVVLSLILLLLLWPFIWKIF